MSWLTRLKWKIWRAAHRREWREFDESAILPNVPLLHQILKRLDSDTFIYLVNKADKKRTFRSQHRNISILISDIERRNKEIEFNRAYGPEKLSPNELTVRSFFIGDDRSYIRYGVGYEHLQRVALELIQHVEKALSESTETLSENYISRRSVKMLLTVERLLMSICQ